MAPRGFIGLANMKSMIPEFNSNCGIKPYEGSDTPGVDVYGTAIENEFVDGCYYHSPSFRESIVVDYFLLAECVYKECSCSCSPGDPENPCGPNDFCGVGYESEAERVDLVLKNPPVGIPLDLELSFLVLSNISTSHDRESLGRLYFKAEILLSKEDIVRDTNNACSWTARLNSIAANDSGELEINSAGWSKNYIKKKIPETQQKGFYAYDLQATVKAKC